MTEPELNKRVAIIGAGLIGCSWAALFMKHRWDVTIWDRNPDVYENVSDTVTRALADLDNLYDPKSKTGSFTRVMNCMSRFWMWPMCKKMLQKT